MTDIAFFRLPNNYHQTLKISACNQSGTTFVSVKEGDSLIGSIQTDNRQELIEFLREHKFQQYEAGKIIPKFFDWMDQLIKEISVEKAKKVNSQRRILIILKRLQNNESLDLKQMAAEFHVSHSQLVRDIAIIRSVFEKPEIRYNRMDNTYKITY